MHLTFPHQLPLTLDRPRIVGILNVTPDSFSDGGRFDALDAAVARAREMVEQGADLIDIGGESSRPGAGRVSIETQIDRVVAVIRAITPSLSEAACDDSPLPISIDTTRRAVAEAALDAGASMINDISAGREDPAILDLAAARGVPICLMHMQGTPGTMQDAPRYDDVVSEVEAFLIERRDAALAAGIEVSQIVLDPGIGFGKTFNHNLALLRALPRFVALGQPILLGASRKRFFARLAGAPPEVKVEPAPFGGTAAATALAVAAGVQLIRVHDVALNRQAADASHAMTRPACSNSP